MDIIPTLIKAYNLIYNKSRLKTVEALIGDENFFREECTFFDDGRIKSAVVRMKNDYDKISNEISYVKNTCSHDDDYAQRIKYLYNRQYKLIILMAYQSSQSYKNIDDSLQLINGFDTPLALGINGIKSYSMGEKENSYRQLTDYLSKEGSFGDHFLMNKIYGKLLIDGKSYQNAIPFLVRAAKIHPEDIETHQLLIECYQQTNQRTKSVLEEDIIELLGA